jgi:hypothetical protein
VSALRFGARETKGVVHGGNNGRDGWLRCCTGGRRQGFHKPSGLTKAELAGLKMGFARNKIRKMHKKNRGLLGLLVQKELGCAGKIEIVFAISIDLTLKSRLEFKSYTFVNLYKFKYFTKTEI